MAYYETVFMARQDLTEAQVKDITSAFEKIITDEKGKILKTESWGLRTLAYRINKARKAHYVLLELDCEAAALHEMERQMRLHEDVMRHLTIRLEEPTEGPSAILGGRDDDDKKSYKNKKEAA